MVRLAYPRLIIKQAANRNFTVMKETDYVTTEFLVLRKTPYSESSLILAGLTPQEGQLKLLIRGARRMERKKFSQLDILQLLEISYRPDGKNISTPRSVDIIHDHRKIAKDYTAYESVCWLIRFALLNAPAGIAHPRFFKAMEIAFERLAVTAEKTHQLQAETKAVLTAVCIVYLEESGFLPHYPRHPRRQQQRQVLIDFGENRDFTPGLTAEVWEQLFNWTISLCRYHDCQIPTVSAS